MKGTYVNRNLESNEPETGFFTKLQQPLGLDMKKAYRFYQTYLAPGKEKEPFDNEAISYLAFNSKGNLEEFYNELRELFSTKRRDSSTKGNDKSSVARPKQPSHIFEDDLFDEEKDSNLTRTPVSDTHWRYTPQQIQERKKMMELVPGHIKPGVRRNNPGNVKPISGGWQGEIGIEEKFPIFKTPEHGLRALALNIITKQRQDGAKTAEELIKIWAPPTDGNHYNRNYETVVYSLLPKTIQRGQEINFMDIDILIPLMKGIVKGENSNAPYPEWMYRDAAMIAIGYNTSSRMRK